MNVKNRYNLFNPVLGIALCATTPFAVAESGHHGAHVHGVAELTLAAEGADLEIEFSSPAISVVGFEHRAVTPAEKDAVADAVAALRDLAGALTLVGAHCELAHSTVDVTAVQAETAEDQTSHGGHGDQHNEHQDDHHDGHHDDHQGKKDSHTDVSAHFAYVCADTPSLESLRVGNDGLPFGLEAIHVMWVTDRLQGAAELTATQRSVEFR